MSLDTNIRVVKNSVWLVTAEMVSKLLALAVQIAAARYLGEKGFGVFAFAFAATSILMILADSGINHLLTREIARRPDRIGDDLGNALALKSGLSLIALAVLFGFPLATAMDPTSRLVVWSIGVALLVNGYADVYIAVFRAREQMSLVSILMMVQRCLFFILGLAALLMGYRVTVFSLTFLTAACINLGLVRRQMRIRYGLQPWRWQWNQVKEIFWSSLPIGGVILFSYIYFRIDSVMLYYLRGDSETGWYSAAFKLVEGVVLLIAGVRGALFPLLSRTYAESSARFQRIWREAARYLLMIGLPAAAGMALLAPRLAILFYGESYEPSGNALRLLALAIPFLCLSDIASYLLVAADRTRKIFRVVGLGALFNIIFNFLLIPRWGLDGAAVATCLTELFVFGVYYKTISQTFAPIGILSLVWRPSASAAGMALILWFCSALPPAGLIPLGAAVYIGTLAALQTFNQHDMAILRGLLGRGQP
ncbi:MAG: flippase [Nitrospinales bacterium]